MSDLLRHIKACNNAVLPGGRSRLMVDGSGVGWLDPALSPALIALGATDTPSGVDVPATRLQPIARSLADAKHFRWRDEEFDVRADAGGQVLTQLDRGALPAFGVQAVGVHLNGLVPGPGGVRLWVARRARDKLLDPGKLDHIVAGGVPAGLSPARTLVKEAAEEAGMPEALIHTARPASTLTYAMRRQEGLRRDRLHCYDVMLPPSFVPTPSDGEVEAFELWDLPDVLDRVRRTDDFKFNVNLVLIDLFLRRGMLKPAEASLLRPALYRKA